MTFQVERADQKVSSRDQHCKSPAMVDVSGRSPIRVPELGIEDVELTVSVWLVPLGSRVAAGDRVVEVLTGEAVVDLPAPIHGTLVEKLVAEDTPVEIGQVLAWIEPKDAAAD